MSRSLNSHANIGIVSDNDSFDGLGSDIEQLSTDGCTPFQAINDYVFGKTLWDYLVANSAFDMLCNTQNEDSLDVSQRRKQSEVISLNVVLGVMCRIIAEICICSMPPAATQRACKRICRSH